LSHPKGKGVKERGSAIFKKKGEGGKKRVACRGPVQKDSSGGSTEKE